MKKIFNIILFFFVSIVVFTISTVNVKAIQPLDRIEYYEITIDPREDATLDMHFKITWTVLDSTTEGPLEWIKIGIPNYYVDEIVGLSDNIKEIKYYSEGGAYIRIDFKKSYYKGSTLDIEFSIHQSRMYLLNEENCYYNYSPGWFNEIKVSRAVIRWNKQNVTNHNAQSEDDNYLIWQASLNYGEKMNINIVYSRSSFINLKEDMQYTSSYMTPEEIRTIIIVVSCLVIFVAVVLIIVRKTQDPYLYERGFYGRRYYSWFRPRRYYRSGYNSLGSHFVSPSHSYGGGSRSSCACACACAGGGRAGCSKKDFYNKRLKLEQIKKVLNK